MDYSEGVLLIGAAESIWSGNDMRINIEIEVSEKLRSALSPYFDNKLEMAFITDSDIRHIKRSHGANDESRGQLNISPRDFAYIPLVLNEFDSCEHTDTDKLGNKKFLLTKNVGEMVYLATIQRGKRKLEIKTMWKKNLPGASC